MSPLPSSSSRTYSFIPNFGSAFLYTLRESIAPFPLFTSCHLSVVLDCIAQVCKLGLLRAIVMNSLFPGWIKVIYLDVTGPLARAPLSRLGFKY